MKEDGKPNLHHPRVGKPTTWEGVRELLARGPENYDWSEDDGNGRATARKDSAALIEYLKAQGKKGAAP